MGLFLSDLAVVTFLLILGVGFIGSFVAVAFELFAELFPYIILVLAITCPASAVLSIILLVINIFSEEPVDEKMAVERRRIIVRNVLFIIIGLIVLLFTGLAFDTRVRSDRRYDAKRVADIKQVQTALELYYNEHDSYPRCGGERIEIMHIPKACTEEITTFFAGISGIKDPRMGKEDNLFPCIPGSIEPCNYTYMDKGSNQYEILFYLENKTGAELTEGLHWATPSGIDR